MSRYVFIAAGFLPVIAFATSRDSMRQYVCATLGLSQLPRRHCVTRIA